MLFLILLHTQTLIHDYLKELLRLCNVYIVNIDISRTYVHLYCSYNNLNIKYWLYIIKLK